MSNPGGQDMAWLKKDTAEALELLRSEEWAVYVAFLKKRAIKLQQDVNEAVRHGNILEAQKCLAVLDDSTNQCDIFKRQVFENREKIKESEG